MISLEGVTKRYGPVVALDGVSLYVAPRARIALVGSSGSGKSTLLRAVLGLAVADAGKVQVDGLEVTPTTCREVRLRTGYVMQDGALFPHLTAKRNVALVAEELGWSRERIAERVATLARLVALPESLLARFPLEMSGGQRQRVGIMRALMLDPHVLLLDEPMGALDPVVARKLEEDLLAIFERLAKTVLLVTHDMAQAAFLAESIAVMKDGAILQRGTKAELLDAPTSPFVTDLCRAHRRFA